MTTERLWALRGKADAGVRELSYFDDEEDGAVLEEFRAPTAEDTLVDVNDVVEFVGDRVRELDGLSWDDGCALLGLVPSLELEALQAALDAYVRAHVDLDEAAYLPTGRTATRTSTGWVFSEDAGD